MDTKEKIYQAIIRYAKTHYGNSPTLREIAEEADVPSTSTINYWLHGCDNSLVMDGRIKFIDRKMCVVGSTWMV